MHTLVGSGFEKGTVLQIFQLNLSLAEPVVDFFKCLKSSGDEQYFHPHPLTKEEAHKRVSYSGKDLYYVLMGDDKVLGYGMLRGWDEGYEIPSLGIAIRPSARGLGLGKLLMQFLHVAAHCKGAKRIRLKVYPDNTIAVKLYESLGYIFQNKEAEQLLGFLEL